MAVFTRHQWALFSCVQREERGVAHSSECVQRLCCGLLCRLRLVECNLRSWRNEWLSPPQFSLTHSGITAVGEKTAVAAAVRPSLRELEKRRTEGEQLCVKQQWNSTQRVVLRLYLKRRELLFKMQFYPRSNWNTPGVGLQSVQFHEEEKNCLLGQVSVQSLFYKRCNCFFIWKKKKKPLTFDVHDKLVWLEMSKNGSSSDRD